MMEDIERLRKKKGIKAIICLQRMAGIGETEESAASGWDRMSEGEKRKTIAAHDFFRSIADAHSDSI